MHKDLIPATEMIEAGNRVSGRISQSAHSLSAFGPSGSTRSTLSTEPSSNAGADEQLVSYQDENFEEIDEEKCEEIRKGLRDLGHKVTAYGDAIVRAHEAIGELQEESDEHDQWKEEYYDKIEEIFEIYLPLLDIEFFLRLIEETRAAAVGAGWFTRSITVLSRFLGEAYVIAWAILEIIDTMNEIIPDWEHERIWKTVMREKGYIAEFTEKITEFENEVADLEERGRELGCDREDNDEPGYF